MARSRFFFDARRFAVRSALLGAASFFALCAAAAQEKPQAPGTRTPASQAEAGEAEAGEALAPIDVDGAGGGRDVGYVAQDSRAGTKTDTPIARTPASIFVVTRQQMDDQDAQSVAEALRYTPGVFAEYRGASNLRDEVFVRGFYYVPRYLDGLFLGGDLSYARIDPNLLERVELISGPASILYGQVNPGGVINMVSKKPTATPFHRIELSLGTKNMFQGTLDMSDKVPGIDTLRYRFVAAGITRNLQENYAKQQGFGFLPSLAWTPDLQTTFILLGGYQYEPDAGFRNFLDAAGAIKPLKSFGYVPRDFFVSDPNYEKLHREQAWLGYEFEHKLNDAVTLRQNARYYWVGLTHHTLIWGSSSLNPETGLTSVSRTASGGDETWRTWTVDSNAEARFSTGPLQHVALGGVDVRNAARAYSWGYNWNVPGVILNNPAYGGYDWGSVTLNPDSDQRLSAGQVGVYLQDQITFGDLNVIAGVRNDWANTAINDRIAATTLGYADSAFTWRVGGLYALPYGVSPYVSYSTSFEPALYAPPAGEGPFAPTTAAQFEAGVKYTPFERALLTFSYFDITQNNVVEGVWDGAVGQTVYSQIGRVRNTGFEFSARVDAIENLSLIASYSYVNSKIQQSKIAAEVGDTPARIPAHQASAWGVYNFTGPMAGFAFGAGARFVGRSWGDILNTFGVPSSIVFDLMAKYDLGAVAPTLKGVEAQVNVKNLGDERYVASCASAYACFYGEGRTVAGTLRYTW